MNDSTRIADELGAAMDRPRGMSDRLGAIGEVIVELHGPDGALKSREVIKNLITSVGDQLYTSRGAGLTTSATPTGMKLGTSGAAPSKTGAGAALVAYLSGSNKAFDAAPTVVGGVATYKRTYAAGEATSAGAIQEAVIVNDAIGTDATSAAAATISRALITTVPSKGALDALTVTWTHTILGA